MRLATAAVAVCAFAIPALASGDNGTSDCGCVIMTAPYNGTSGTADHRVAVPVPGAASAHGHFSLTPTEQKERLRHVQVTVVDQLTGGPIQFELEQAGRSLGVYCYRSPRLHLTRPATTFDVYVLTGECAAGPSIPASGGIQIVLTR
jgi:hypothetical protein